MAKEKNGIRVIIFGQDHYDPAPYVAAYNLIKRLQDNGIPVSAAFEGYWDTKKYEEVTKDNIIFKEAVKKLTSPHTPPQKFESRVSNYSQENIRNIFRDKAKITQNCPEFNELLGLLRYLNENKIIATPLQNDKLKKELNDALENKTRQEQDKVFHSFEPKRIELMLKKMAQHKNEIIDEGHTNGVIVVFNLGMMHQERLAKHLQKEGYEVDVIECTPSDKNMIDPNQAGDRIALSMAVDSAEIQKMPVNVNVVELNYDQTKTEVVINKDLKTIGTARLGDFPDFTKISKHLDGLIPPVSITLPTSKITPAIEEMIVKKGGVLTEENDKSTLIIRRDNFDKELRDKLGFEKKRITTISPEKADKIAALNESIAIFPDQNQEKGTFLYFAPTELTTEIEKIRTEKEVKGNFSAKALEEEKAKAASSRGKSNKK
jgi:hypothetical protein